MKLFYTVLKLHFLEHLAQMIQVYILNMPRTESLGLIGLWFPYLIRSEWLHFGFAIYTLNGIYRYTNNKTAFYLQLFHTVEHIILINQYFLGYAATGIGGIWFPRIELHFFYNLIVLLPLISDFTKSES